MKEGKQDIVLGTQSSPRKEVHLVERTLAVLTLERLNRHLSPSPSFLLKGFLVSGSAPFSSLQKSFLWKALEFSSFIIWSFTGRFGLLRQIPRKAFWSSCLPLARLLRVAALPGWITPAFIHVGLPPTGQ